MMTPFKLKVKEDGSVKVTNLAGKAAEKLDKEGLKRKLQDIDPNNFKVEITDQYTYIQTKSGVVCINGVWYYIP